MRSLLSLSLFLAAALLHVSTSAAQVGAVLREQRINEHEGGLSVPLANETMFGHAVAGIGDLNRDGIGDLAVGAPGDWDGVTSFGAVWILFLKADGRVQSHTRIRQASGAFGARLAAIGDLDGDGVSELAVTADRPRRIVILFLNSDGTVRAQREILWSDPVFGGATSEGHFQTGPVARLGDVDRDGIPDLAWGARHASPGAQNAGAVWIVRLNADGSAKAASMIANGHGGFTGVLAAGDRFGLCVQLLGDVNGDGHVDLGVVDNETAQWTLGRLWILFLDAGFQVIGHRVVSGVDFNLSWEPQHRNNIGADLDLLGDLDGDGIAEIALHGNGNGPNSGFVVGFLAPDGSLRKRLLVGQNSTGSVHGLPVVAHRRQFAWSLDWLGDLDGDGAPEFAVGDPADRQSGFGAGSVSILTLDTDAVRNGSGVNPLTLTQLADPVLGAVWKAQLDCSGHAPGFALLTARDRPLAGVFSPAGELLISGTPVFRLSARHAGGPAGFALLVPDELVLVNLTLHAQGLCSGAPGPRLSNALDVQIGR